MGFEKPSLAKSPLEENVPAAYTDCMKHFTYALLAALFIAVLAVPALSAQEQGDEPDKEQVFLYFLFLLADRNEELGTMAMPDFEILTVPGREGEALYMITFKTVQDTQTFIAALKKDDIPYLSFPDKEQHLALFYTDMLAVIMKAVLEF